MGDAHVPIDWIEGDERLSVIDEFEHKTESRELERCRNGVAPGEKTSSMDTPKVESVETGAAQT